MAEENWRISINISGSWSLTDRTASSRLLLDRGDAIIRLLSADTQISEAAERDCEFLRHNGTTTPSKFKMKRVRTRYGTRDYFDRIVKQITQDVKSLTAFDDVQQDSDGHLKIGGVFADFSSGQGIEKSIGDGLADTDVADEEKVLIKGAIRELIATDRSTPLQRMDFARARQMIESNINPKQSSVNSRLSALSDALAKSDWVLKKYSSASKDIGRLRGYLESHSIPNQALMEEGTEYKFRCADKLDDFYHGELPSSVANKDKNVMGVEYAASNISSLTGIMRDVIAAARAEEFNCEGAQCLSGTDTNVRLSVQAFWTMRSIGLIPKSYIPTIEQLTELSTHDLVCLDPGDREAADWRTQRRQGWNTFLKRTEMTPTEFARYYISTGQEVLYNVTTPGDDQYVAEHTALTQIVEKAGVFDDLGRWQGGDKPGTAIERIFEESVFEDGLHSTAYKAIV
ncbi:uncharacterized protein I303_103606 [Kwoniella dejecticola CBS 10117]|uniref:Uncharacterized protein n=1 Tax=Kwoniella dejecticola CBS 10117 TaxID=1296121 RepID=A0A1A6A784_9TREE|nr:uncharacterized protein I303_03628 [Kwoniella dejecticola CBS 10117]OBR85913.1 hypothetical protein I303_03628 [Kwoniella dejecticola CBS 10117]